MNQKTIISFEGNTEEIQVCIPGKKAGVCRVCRINPADYEIGLCVTEGLAGFNTCLFLQEFFENNYIIKFELVKK